MFIVEKQPSSIAAESYRTLRTNIQYSSFDESLKTIVITSSEPGEGKTTTAGNLALSLAKDEKRVMLIDCDLRKPSIHRRFKISNGGGISEVIIGKNSLESVTREVFKNLDVITSGNIPPNPAEMLGSKPMQIILNNLKEKYDYVILDTPPVLPVTDAQVLSAKVDGVILVVKAEKTKSDSIIKAKKLLDKVHAKFIGSILNDIDIKKNSYYYYYGNEDDGHKRVKKKARKRARARLGKVVG